MPSEPRSARRLLSVAAVATVAASATLASAHPDDPKVRDKMPRYEGPGWVEASDAAGPDFEAVGMTLRSWISLPEFGTNPDSGNDCWGWTSPLGREYALMGLNNGTAFVDVTDPGNPEIRNVIPGPSSLWRDVKTYQNHAYVVTEAVGGQLQVVDLSGLDAGGEAILVNTVSGPGTSSTHNVAIDEVSGFLYRSGGGNEGIRIYDLADPVNPSWVATWSTKYVHDLQIVTYDSGPYAGRQLAYLCGGFNGGFVETGVTVLDVTDKSNLQVISEMAWPSSAYSHQAWLNEDRTKLYVNDELDEGDFGIPTTIHVLDVSDPGAISYEGAFTNGNPAVGHNLYIKGDRLYGAHYRSGVRVFDLASDPLAPAEIAFFDTFPGSDDAFFNGAWNVYPFFESGTILISDLERGLFVVDLQEPRVAVSYPAGRPELVDPAGGVIRAGVDELIDGALDGATVRLVSDLGEGATGVPMSQGKDGVWEGMLPVANCGDVVAWWIEVEFDDAERTTSPVNAPDDAWSALAAVGRDAAFEDDGETSAGWTVQNIAITGGPWERGLPAGDGFRGDPLADFDGSGRCWLTGNEAGNSDVDGGPTILTSRSITIAADGPVFLRYARWFTNDDLDIDTLRTEYSVDGGATWQFVEETGSISGWQERTARLDTIAPPLDSVRVRFLATDNPNDSVTEAGIDAVRIEVLDCGAPSVPEDVNGDGTVGFEDLLAVLASFGPCDGTPCASDVNDTGVVDFADLLAVLAAWS
jgi:choice-of-anchor B domain-containing protein